jgi:hypothetical protein
MTSSDKEIYPLGLTALSQVLTSQTNGIKSYTKSFQLGPFQLTLNASDSGVLGSVSLPGTGLSKRNIKII